MIKHVLKDCLQLCTTMLMCFTNGFWCGLPYPATALHLLILYHTITSNKRQILPHRKTALWSVPQGPRIDQIVEEYAMRNDWSLFSNKTWGANLTPQKNELLWTRNPHRRYLVHCRYQNDTRGKWQGRIDPCDRHSAILQRLAQRFQTSSWRMESLFLFHSITGRIIHAAQSNSSIFCWKHRNRI